MLGGPREGWGGWERMWVLGVGCRYWGTDTDAQEGRGGQGRDAGTGG